MTQLNWNQSGERFFETGLDRGVLYPTNNTGVAWNGLVAVNESTEGGTATPYFMDGIKYENVPESEEFTGTIEAFTYPDEFESFDGYEEVYPGVSAAQQYRESFGLSYRTKIGNDTQGDKLGYKLHVLYNLTVAPSDRNNNSQNDTPEPITFSWPVTSIAEAFRPGVKPTSHLIFNSTKINPLILETIENALYGTVSTNPRILLPLDIIAIYEDILPGYFGIDDNPGSGLAILVEGGGSDLQLGGVEGLYISTPTTRLTETATAGLYTLED